MRWFGRRSRDEDPAAGESAPEAEQPDQDVVEDADPGGSGLSPRHDGPWDVAERDQPEGYVDLGAVLLRGREGMELRLDVEEGTGSVTSATVQLGASAVQLQAFAAPRSEGIWPEIRAEIAAGITQQGGTVDEQQGAFGPELLARIPVRTADGRTGHQPARFAGIDGPRWFLRAVFHGAAVAEPAAAQELESVVRDVVVVRGPEAMAPRELLPLHLPQEVVGEAAGAAESGAEAGGTPESRRQDDLDPFARGPEITEVR